MRTYLRNRVSGGTYFFTVNLAERRGNALLVDRIDALRTALHATHEARPFDIIAMVVLPDHLHALWKLPEGDADYSTRLRLFKGRFAHAVASHDRRSSSRLRRKERGIWQRRFWEHTIRDDNDLYAHIDYIHYNPVKHGLCDSPARWRYSSFHRFVKNGLLSPNWSQP